MLEVEKVFAGFVDGEDGMGVMVGKGSPVGSSVGFTKPAGVDGVVKVGYQEEAGVVGALEMVDNG